MITLRSRRYLLLLSWIASVGLSFASPTPSTQSVPHPFYFTENKGQWDARVLYKCNARNGMTWFLEKDGVTLLISQEDRTASPLPDDRRGVWHTPAFESSPCSDPFDDALPKMMRRYPHKKYPMKCHALKFKFLDVGGASPAPTLDNSKGVLHTPPLAFGNCVVLVNRDPSEKINMGRMQYALTDDPPQSVFAKSIEPQGELPWHNNYFLGNDSTKWAPDCRNYSSIIYRDLWDGIDIEWYESNGKLEFDFVVQPGADPSQIRMSCDGLDGELSLSDQGRGEQCTEGAQHQGKSHSPIRKGALRTPAVSCTLDTSSRSPAGAVAICSGNLVVGADRDPPATDGVRALLRDARTTGGMSSFTLSSNSHGNDERTDSVCVGASSAPKMRSIKVNGNTPALVSCAPVMSSRGLTTATSSRKDVAIVSVSGNPAVGAGLDQPAIRHFEECSVGSSGCDGQPQRNDEAISAFNKTNTEKEEIASSLRPHKVAGFVPRNDITGYTTQTETGFNRAYRGYAPTMTCARVGAELLLPTSLGELRTALPQVYQISPNGTRSEVDAQFILTDTKNEFGVSLPNGYSPRPYPPHRSTRL